MNGDSFIKRGKHPNLRWSHCADISLYLLKSTTKNNLISTVMTGYNAITSLELLPIHLQELKLSLNSLSKCLFIYYNLNGNTVFHVTFYISKNKKVDTSNFITALLHVSNSSAFYQTLSEKKIFYNFNEMVPN